jgi:hypothetical protein
VIAKSSKLLFILLFGLLITGCTPNTTSQLPPTSIPQNKTSTPIQIPPTTETPRPVGITPTSTLPAVSPSATLNVTTTPDTRLTAKYWREWPIVPELSPRAHEILQAAANPSLDAHTFSKVGDCQFTPETFLGGYAKGIYPIPNGLETTVTYFQASMVSDSITAHKGLGISSALNPMFGAGSGHTECNSNEAPLDCELRLRRPILVLIAMGTNWKPHSSDSFERYLRQIVDKTLATGALPILATKADNIEEDWKLNEAIAHVAYDYDLPLVNAWRAVQFLPNHGLESPKNIYLTGNGWLARNDAWLRTLDVLRIAIEQDGR